MKIADESLQSLAKYIVGLYVWFFTVVAFCYIAFKVISTFKNLEVLIVVVMAGFPGVLYAILHRIFNEAGERWIMTDAKRLS